MHACMHAYTCTHLKLLPRQRGRLCLADPLLDSHALVGVAISGNDRVRQQVIGDGAQELCSYAHAAEPAVG